MYSRSRRRTHSSEVRRDSLNKFGPILGGNWYCLIENIFLHIKCKERSIDCTSALMFVLSILKLSRDAIELQTVSEECWWIAFALKCLPIVPDDFQDNVNDSNVGVNESIFSLLYAQWREWMPKNVIECWLKCKNRYYIWFMRKCSLFRANECIFALLVAVLRKWMRIFS